MVCWTLKRVMVSWPLLQSSMRAKPSEEGESGQSPKICTVLLWKGLGLSSFTLFKAFTIWKMTLQYEYLHSQPVQWKRCRVFFQTAIGITVVSNELCATEFKWVGQPWNSELPERLKVRDDLDYLMAFWQTVSLFPKTLLSFVPRPELYFLIQKNHPCVEKIWHSFCSWPKTT